MDIIKKDYPMALDRINDCINNYKDGGFMDNNGKSIIELAKKYCEKEYN